MKIDGVFSGGGVKAFAFIGALEVLEEKGFTFERLAGTSAGAILASLLAAGYTVKEIELMLMNLDLKKFLDTSIMDKYIPICKVFSLYFTMGIYKGDAFEKWLYQRLAYKNVYTFRDLPEGLLKVVVADLSLGKIVVLPDDLERLYGIKPESFLIATAVRMSASLPYFFRPKKLVNTKNQKSIIVDGAILSNTPMWIFDKDRSMRRRPLLGMNLSAAYDQIPEKKITNAFNLSEALVTTMRLAHDARYISKKHTDDLLFIPVKEVDVSDLSLSKDSKRDLILFGKKRATSFLTHWPN
ncbi:patatin-like phospholipase family protein [Paraliobacillus sp. X-1268]|uniref:patatin-like phospholipase family protein n=1 Tax=Paraliobacillus sp. X-1268 TaxID=2213193 RepID=UPI000E3CF2FA|nr:patatin-like phospholipase family protein [Paraliobacillus sp. X-1268]